MVLRTGAGHPSHTRSEASVKFSSGEAQKDSFAIDVLPRPATPQVTGKVAVFDPKGETVKLLGGMGVHGGGVEANANVSAYDTLIIGKGALTLQGAARLPASGSHISVP